MGNLSLFFIGPLHLNFLLVQLINLFLKLFNVRFQFLQSGVNLRFRLFGGQCMAHSVADAAVVKALVGVELITQLVADLNKQKASFGAVNRYLAN